MSDDLDHEFGKKRAQQRAERDAQKKAGVYLQTFSRSINSELAEDAISAVTNNILEVIGDVHYDKKLIPLSDSQTTILYTATLKARIDTDGIYDWIKRDDKEKVTIIQQNDQLQDAIQKNDELAESLTEQYMRAKTQAEKDKLRKQMTDADRDFLVNQKFEEALKLYYAKDYHDAIKFYNEVLTFGEYANVYYNRGLTYSDLGQKERAIQDFDKAIQINPNDYVAYYNRGNAYLGLQQNEQAIKDYDKAIELNPNYANAYYNRGLAYHNLNNNKQALADFGKYIQLVPSDPDGWQMRGECYQALGDNAKAQADFAKAKELGYNG